MCDEFRCAHQWASDSVGLACILCGELHPHNPRRTVPDTHAWTTAGDYTFCQRCGIDTAGAKLAPVCLAAPSEEDDPAWLTWHPAPLTAEQRFLLRQLGDGAVFLLHDQNRACGIRPLAHVQWAIQHEYVRYDGRSRHNRHVLRFVISEAGWAALRQAVGQGEG